MKHTFKILVIASVILLSACGKEESAKAPTPLPAPAMSAPTPPAATAGNATGGAIVLVDADAKAEYVEKMKLAGKKSVKGEDCVQVCMEASSQPRCAYLISLNGCYVDPNLLISTRR